MTPAPGYPHIACVLYVHGMSETKSKNLVFSKAKSHCSACGAIYAQDAGYRFCAERRACIEDHLRLPAEARGKLDIDVLELLLSDESFVLSQSASDGT